MNKKTLNLVKTVNNMTKEEKELLLKDLCGRLPYGVLCEIDFIDIPVKLETIIVNGEYLFFDDGVYERYITQVKPYLRPMSSITEEEAAEFEILSDKLLMEADNTKIWNSVVDWLNEHAFDHRGLISMGLALEAPEDMYNV